ncbi:MAG TPA: hypothetical protein VF677_04740 [Flavobacterium sp.]
MKHSKSLLIAFLLFASATVPAQSTSDKWPAIKAFHEVISVTFHPSEEGNLQPIKKRSKELLLRAEAILKSDIPVAFKTPQIIKSAKKLQVKTKALHEMIVAKATDAAITKSLSEVHDIFHEIQGLCSTEKH